ncbi:AfsR/SARP family transcriptional regulator [Lentzea kentuckyensis]|uniref:AfsR/SARP family transcriptional regulator n=1 Tax=Lentzea kentuckyensis TaxID=360086 RepID=UPI000A361FC8|nr:hypothetical protein [Lentzea kentuckyensis]
MKTEFGVLGPLRVAVEGKEVDLDQPMLRRLLAVLLCQANSPVSAGALADAWWETSPPSSEERTSATAGTGDPGGRALTMLYLQVGCSYEPM